MQKFDILIKGGWVVDPANNRQGRFDVGIREEKIVAVERELVPDLAQNWYNAANMLVLPGLVDTHVHLTPMLNLGAGFRMLARAGVTCALDCGGPVDDVIEGMAQQGSGISVAVLNKLDPGETISGPDVDRNELSEYLNRSLAQGALGLKILGGHLPLSPETTIAAIEVANAAGAYVAFHCGSTRNGSNLNGLLDAFEFAGKNRLQVCHINAYCRGLTHGSPVTETMIALKELAARRHLVSESHLAPYNCTSARLEGDIPRSHVTRTCLTTGGYEASREGLLAAAESGYMRVCKGTPHEVQYLEPEAGVAFLKEAGFLTSVSFPVNRRSTAFLTATEKEDKEDFIVTAISTDGGGIPRNFLLSHGLSLVRFDALTLPEFVQKCAWTPAKMLGLFEKGHLGVGADGDLVVADPATRQALLTVANGKAVMIHGMVIGSGGTLIVSDQCKRVPENKAIPVKKVDLEKSLLYTAPSA